jgi:hypothetical protein
MKWVCLLIAVFALVMLGTVLFGAHYPGSKTEAVRISLTAFVVNGAFFAILHFRKPATDLPPRFEESNQPTETTRGK